MKSILLTLLLAATLGTSSPQKSHSQKPVFNQPTQRAAVLDWQDAQYIIESALFLDSTKPWVNDPEDSIYVAPTGEDIADLLTFIRHRKEGLDYLSDGFDCDDFGTEAKYWATVWSVRYYQKSPAGLLFGKAYVHIHGSYDALFTGSGGSYIDAYHVLNFVVRSDGRVFFFEPQTGVLAPVEALLYEDSLTVLRVEY
jgi:agglutinin domain-containing protein